MGAVVGPPQPITERHVVEGFSSGYPVLDDWLVRRALSNHESGASRCYVVEAEGRVVGYYALAAGSVMVADAPGKIRRNMPDPVPVMVLGRLAVDRALQGQGLGSSLLADAIRRTRSAASIAGMRALMVHAIDDKAAAFYERSGLSVSIRRPLTYFLLLHPLPRDA